MGYSSEAIFMKPRISEDEELKLIKSLGFDNYVFNRKAPFEEADLRGKNGVYIGHCNDSTFIIYDKMLHEDLRMNDLTPLERALNQRYPDKEFLSITNFEVINGYLYHYFKAEKTIRLKQGYDPYVFLNIGDELDIEKEYYVKKETEAGEEVFYTKHWDKENPELLSWKHHQIGGAVAFKLVKMMAGVAYRDATFFDLELNQYISEKGTNEITAKTIEDNLRRKQRPETKPVKKSEPASAPIIDNQNPIKEALLQEEEISSEILTSYRLDKDKHAILSRNEIEIEASASAVWACLTNFKLWPTWHSAISSPKMVKFIRNGPDALWLLTAFKWTYLGVGLTSLVREYQTNQQIGWVASSTGTIIYFHWQIIASEKGCRVVLKTVQSGWRVHLRNFFKPHHTDHQQNWLNALKERALAIKE